MDAQDVTALGHFRGRAGKLHGDRFAGDALFPRRKPAAPDDDGHAEGVRPLRHLLTDVAVAEQTERPAEQATRLRVLLLVPGAGAQIGHVVRHPAVDREQQRERELGHRDRILARAVRDVDAAPGRGRDIDGVVAGPGANDERQCARFEHRGVHGGAADHEHVGGGIAKRLRQPVVLEVRLIDDVAAGGLQPVDSGLLKCVGDEDFHIDKPQRRHGDTENLRIAVFDAAPRSGDVRSTGLRCRPPASITSSI